MKKTLSLFLAVLMMLSIFAGLEMTAEASYGRVPYVYATVTEPSVGAKPAFSATVSSQYSNQVYNSYRNGDTMIDGVEWYDVTAQKSLGRNDVFVAGHEYTVGVLITCGSDYRFKHDNQPDTITFNSKYDGIGYYYPVGDYADNELYYYIQYTFEALPQAKNGWNNDYGYWMYFENGKAVTGWKSIGGKWYFFDTEGVMKTGWVQSGGKWYFLSSSGAMATGWVQSGGKWYFLSSSGAMVTGWVQSGGKWYYMNSSGAMQTGWVKSGSKWYFMNSSGAMVTGWVKSGGKWYYMDSSGAMLANTSRKIGSKTYKFNSSGVCTNP